MPKLPSRILKSASLALAGFITFAVFVALYRDTYYNGWDFDVFHRAASAVLRGESPYLVGMGSGWVFKYPPWVLPAFLPFGLLPVLAAKGAWGMAQILCLVYAVRWLVQQGLSLRLVWFTALPFWFIWAYHALSGQFTLMMLAIALWASRLDSRPKQVLVTWAMTSKIFSVFTIGGALARSEQRLKLRPCVKTLAWIAVCFAVLTIPALIATQDMSPLQLLRDWSAAAGSGATDLQDNAARGWRNQGFPAAILRALGVTGAATGLELGLFAGLSLILGGAWAKGSAKLRWPIQWSGWLALGVAAHPLAWFHSFVLAFPLACFAVDEALKSRSRLRTGLAILGVLAMTVMTKNSLGSAGLYLELASIKSWGVLLCAISLLSKRSSHQSNF